MEKHLIVKPIRDFAAAYHAFGNCAITVGTTALTRGYFLAPDPYIQDPANSQNFNRYSYCLNNPLKYTDPSGEFFQYILGGIFGGIQGFSIGKNAGLTGWKLFGTTIIGAGIGAISGGIAADVTANYTMEVRVDLFSYYLVND